MHRRFKAWLEAKRSNRPRSKKRELDISDPGIAFLPDPRPRALTPSSPTEDTITQSQMPPFFTLPPELRRKILVEAFGDRTIHIDLVLDHPLRLQRSDRRDPKHRFAADHGHYWPETSGNLGLDRSQPKQWQWRGCVCHRLPPPQYCREKTVPGWEQPADDHCCEGESAYHCVVWVKTLKDPKCCWIGVMGWLLSCRQAYIEGTEVLYSTNTVHLGSKPLLENLPALILPQRLSLIRALEVVWAVGTHEHQGKAAPDKSELKKVLHILDTHFPTLSGLHLGVKLDLPIVQRRNSIPILQRAYLDEMLETVDDFVKRRKCHLRKPFILSITTSAWRDLEQYIRTGHFPEMGLLINRIWRYLPDARHLDKLNEIEDATADKGYWIWRDQDSIRRSMYLMGR